MAAAEAMEFERRLVGLFHLRPEGDDTGEAGVLVQATVEWVEGDRGGRVPAVEGISVQVKDADLMEDGWWFDRADLWELLGPKGMEELTQDVCERAVARRMDLP